MGTSKTATENGIKHTLSVVRDAIERYAADNGGQLPLGADLPLELKPYLRGDFPTNPLADNNDIAVDATADDDRPTASGSEGWKYKPYNGDFICNSTGTTEAGVSLDEL